MPEERPGRDADHARWEALFTGYADLVYAYAARRVPIEDAPDVVAETFVVAGRRTDDVPEDALPWLYAVARNVMRNQRRAADRRAALRGKLSRTQTPPPEVPPELEEIEARDAVTVALSRLPTAEREALLLVVWEDLDAARGAQVLGCSPAAFSVRVHRAKRRLRSVLAEPEGWGSDLRAADGGAT